MAYFLGLDLAWGENAWTGVAVVDESGRLLEMDRVRTDAEIERRLRPYLDGPVVLGIDAPIIVRNESGRRPCESQVSRVFGRFHAGAHSSNLSLPSFRAGPRGGTVASMLGLGVDPAFEPRSDVRRAIEVYPHPATITLFGLDRVLPYKAKQGRSPAARREAFLELMQRTAGLASADPPLTVNGCAAWERARAVVDDATTHGELNTLEDALDAVLCAYVARHRWEHGDAESAVFGDTETGYIVVPLDDRVRGNAGHAAVRLSNTDVENLAVDLVTRTARARGSDVVDTRHVAGALGDLLVDGRAVEVKASAGSVRGEQLWLEPRQVEALLADEVDLVLVEHVQPDVSGVVRRLDRATLTSLLPRLQEHRYFTLPVPVAVYDGLPAEHVPPR